MRLDGHRWKAFAKPGKKLLAGDRIRFGAEGGGCLFGHPHAAGEGQGGGGGK